MNEIIKQILSPYMPAQVMEPAPELPPVESDPEVMRMKVQVHRIYMNAVRHIRLRVEKDGWGWRKAIDEAVQRYDLAWHKPKFRQEAEERCLSMYGEEKE